MSDYMFMLESHLSPEQNRAVALMTEAASQHRVPVFLAGGALRDMLGGFAIRGLDFVTEGDPGKLIQWLVRKYGVLQQGKAKPPETAKLIFPGNVFVTVTMAHTAVYPRAGGKPVIRRASIHDHLLSRDFTINSAALSLTDASRGLLMDPANGLGDLERRELRANSSQTLYDDPSRMLRMFRLRVRLGLEIDPRTRSQYENARQAGFEKKIARVRLLEEFRKISREPSPELVLEELQREGLLPVFGAALAGARFNATGFHRLARLRQLAPFGIPFEVDNFSLFLEVLAEGWSGKEQQALVNHLGISQEEVKRWHQLARRISKLEAAMKSPKLKKASLVYRMLQAAPGEDVLLLGLRSSERIVQDRLRNYLQKYLLVASEVSDRELAHLGLPPESPKFQKAKQELIDAYLDGRVRKPVPVEEPAVAASAAGRR
jgi:tRNA nucleotidyltransferase/poly(A) polymerase